MKIRPVGAYCSTRTDGRTDERTRKHDEANSRFSQFCERVSKNIFSVIICIKYRAVGVLTSALHQQSSIKVDRSVKYLSIDNLKV